MNPMWNYGNAYLRHPINDKQIVIFLNGSKVKVHNIFDPLPEFMYEADIIFVDPPWNLGNLNTFYTKAGRTDKQDNFEKFYNRLFDCIAEIKPHTCYVEVGKEYLSEFIQKMKQLYTTTTFYNSSYYHRRENICYVIQGSGKRKKLPLDYVDEEDIIKWICQNEEYECIGDLCMGKGLVGLAAYSAGKKFVGTELNPRRLAVLLDKLDKMGLTYKLEDYFYEIKVATS